MCLSPEPIMFYEHSNEYVLKRIIAIQCKAKAADYTYYK